MAPIAITSLKTGPQAMSDALRLQAEVSNLPRVGYEGNYMFPTMQLNIAATKPADALAASEFKNDLGQFAGKHIGQHDSAGGYTCIVKPTGRSYRFVGVAYPSSPMLDGLTLVALAALPKDHTEAHTNNANWIADGPWLTTRQAYVDFVYRASGELLHYTMKQIPDKLDLQLDFEQLREAMSLKDENAVRRASSGGPTTRSSTVTSSLTSWHTEDHSNNTTGRSNRNNAAGPNRAANTTAGKRSRKRKAPEDPLPPQPDPHVQAGPSSLSPSSSTTEPLVEEAGLRRSKRIRVQGGGAESGVGSDDDDGEDDVRQLVCELQPLSVSDNISTVRSPLSPNRVVNENAQIHSVAAMFNKNSELNATAFDVLAEDDISMASQSDSETGSGKLNDQESPLQYLWRVWESQAEVVEFSKFTIALERSRLMVSNTAAWMWLTQDCIAHTRAVLTSLLHKHHTPAPRDADWRTLLVEDFYALWSQRKAGTLNASHYLPNVAVAQPVELTTQIIRFIRSWLAFPSNSTLLTAYFVMYTVTTLQNVDVLLFSDVLEGAPEHHGSFAYNPLSVEAEVLQAISHVINNSSPAMQAFKSLIVEQLQLASGCPLPPAIALAPCYSRSQPTSTPAPGPSISPGDDSVVLARALHSLLGFVRQLILLIHDPAAAQTVVQKLVASHLGYAPSRLILTGAGSPFHSALADAPGAFASQAISRAYLFDSPALHGDHTFGYFEDVAAWDFFLEECGYDGTAQSVVWMVNMSCYGSAQAQRVTTLDQISPFFESEELWAAFIGVLWLQSTRKVPGKCKNVKILPLFGALTAYLFTADLVYTGKVAAPTVEELGAIIHSNNLGSQRCLGILSPRCGPSSSEADTILAYEVYTFLDHMLTKEEKTSITFDGIMVEHLLCKYQHVLRRVGEAGMSGQDKSKSIKSRGRKGKGKGRAKGN
ncbi:hypothetical protein C8Q80DRAFT_1273930 [Daedaleopsis nitida]|nr:hypothetical protein C8Q80DRAFT_1273930 [Daedaleopsis nitida]